MNLDYLLKKELPKEEHRYLLGSDIFLYAIWNILEKTITPNYFVELLYYWYSIDKQFSFYIINTIYSKYWNNFISESKSIIVSRLLRNLIKLIESHHDLEFVETVNIVKIKIEDYA